MYSLVQTRKKNSFKLPMSLSLPDLPRPSFEALAKAALLEDPFLTQALIASGTPPEALDPLFDNELLEESDVGEACLNTELSRNEILGRLPWSAKRKLSHSLAETHTSLNAAPASIARLYLQAQQHSAARQFFIKAAKIECEKHDYRAALANLQAAFEVWPIDQEAEKRQSVLHEMARCANNCQDYQAATQALEELLEMAILSHSIDDQIDLNQRLAQAAISRGDHLQARERFETAANIASSVGQQAKCARMRRRLAQAQGDALRLREAIATLEDVSSAAQSCEEWALLSDALAYSAMLTAMLGRINEARQILERALSLAIEKDLPDQIANAYRRQANINEYASNYEAYRDSELAALDRCRALDQKSGAQACLTCVSYAFFRLGQYQESLAAIEEAINDLEVDGELLAGALCIKASIQALQTNAPGIQAQLDEAIRFNRIHGGRVFEFYALWAMGANAVLSKKAPEAREVFLSLISFWKETDDRKDVVPGILCASSFFASENSASKLAICIDILNTITNESESLEPRYALLLASGEDAWLHGQAELAIARLKEASQGYESLQLPFEKAWALWRLAFVQSQAGKSGEAKLSWKAAEELAKRHSLKPLAQSIAADRRQSQIAEGSSTALTARQLEVARLIAAGHSNKDAADKLRISPRTVEMHVASLIERLGCRTRAEAASKASQLGLL